MLFIFMHHGWSSKLTWIFAAPGFFLVILIALTLSDSLSRGYLPIYGASLSS